MNFQNNQQRTYFSQRKGDIIPPKPKKRININPTNSNAVDKVAADKEKKAKSSKNKVINQWITTEEDDHEPTPVKPLESHDTIYPSMNQTNVPTESTSNSTPVTTETKASEEHVKNVENIEQKPEIPVDNKNIESETTPQEPLQEASNHRNQKSEYEGNQRRYPQKNHHHNYEKQGNQNYGNQNYGNQNYYKKTNNNNNYYGGGNRNARRDDNYYDDAYYESSDKNNNYYPKKNDNDNYHGGGYGNNNSNNRGYQPKKSYDTRSEVIYVKKN
jgi:hypothetical protein